MTDTISKERVIENAQNIYDMFVSNYGFSSVLALEMKAVLDSLRAALAQKAEQDEVGINGLTDAETRATMSVRGLSKPKKKLTSYERKCFNDWKNP